MVTARELLSSVETEGHIVIGNDRFITVPAALKRLGVQYDHNMETVTFDCPRYWDNRDMSQMAVYINYMLSNGYGDRYPADNVRADGEIMHFEWTISRNVTQVPGAVPFLICVMKTDSEGNEERHWNSEICQECYISAGMETEESPVDAYPDLVTQLLLRMSSVEQIAVTYTPQTLTEEQQLQVRKNIGISDDLNIHAEYFTITEDGVLSLRPEYRGASTTTKYPEGISKNGVGLAGGNNAELPACLVIPEVVNGIAVDSIAKGAFICNSSIQSIVFPKTVKEIPEACFGSAANLKAISNTEGVTSIEDSAFMSSGIKSANFPNLQTLGSRAFAQCTDLIHVNVGKITEIQTKTFLRCYDLSRVDSENLITSVGDTAFYTASNLVNAKFVKNLTSIGKCAFIGCGLNYDWDKLTECTFGDYATAWQLQYQDSTKFWENCTYTACKNPIPTRLSQTDPRWTNEDIGTSGFQWKDGCMLFSLMHAYSGLNDIAFATVYDFAEEVEKITPGHLNNWPGGYLKNMQAFAQPLGLTLTEYSCFNQSNLQALYDALAAGKYAMVTVSGSSDIDGHSILAYGITESGKIMFIDSDYAEFHDRTKARIFKCSYQNQIGRDNLKTSSADGKYDDVWFCIVEKTQ